MDSARTNGINALSYISSLLKKCNRLSLILLNSFQIIYGLGFSYNVMKKFLNWSILIINN